MHQELVTVPSTTSIVKLCQQDSTAIEAPQIQPSHLTTLWQRYFYLKRRYKMPTTIQWPIAEWTWASNMYWLSYNFDPNYDYLILIQLCFIFFDCWKELNSQSTKLAKKTNIYQPKKANTNYVRTKLFCPNRVVHKQTSPMMAALAVNSTTLLLKEFCYPNNLTSDHLSSEGGKG